MPHPGIWCISRTSSQVSRRVGRRAHHTGPPPVDCKASKHSRSRNLSSASRSCTGCNTADYEVGEPGVAELVQGPAAAGRREYLGGSPVGQPGPAGSGVEVGQGWLGGGGGSDVGEEHWVVPP